MRRALLALGAVALLGLAYLGHRLTDRPSLESYRDLVLGAAPDPTAVPGRALAPGPERAGALRLTFLGVSTVLIDDGETALLTDGFFSRPGLAATLLRRLTPDTDAIARHLARAGIERLAAVLVAHSHYDHVMDAPEVARRTDAVLVGSPSTANVGRGWGLGEDRLRVIAGGERLRFGRFEVTVVRARHFPHGRAMGEIRAPLRPPARAWAYLEGGSFSFLVTHGGRSLLVHASAGYREGALAEHRADVALLGIGGLGTRDDAYRDAYWREVVTAVGARRVLPIHWDDFTRPLDDPLVPLPRLIDDVETSMRFLVARGRAAGVDVRLLPVWAAVDPFAGL